MSPAAVKNSFPEVVMKFSGFLQQLRIFKDALKSCYQTFADASRSLLVHEAAERYKWYTGKYV